MRVSMPINMTQQIGYSAARRAMSYMAMRNWGKNSQAITPIFGVGYAGIKVGSGAKYLMYQEKGTQSFLMKALEGKTVPIKGPDGLHFVKVKGVGQPGYVNINGQKIWRNQKWLHPGIKRTDFMANSIAYAILDNRPLIKSLMGSLIGLDGGVMPT